MSHSTTEHSPGFQRRFRITPEPGRVCCEVEDDYHCMSVVLYHDGAFATKLEPQMRRVPWTTCPGAVAELQATFTGIALQEFASRGAKKTNCTHLHDLAILAAKHAFDKTVLIIDISISDPVDGRRQASLYANGRILMNWTEAEFSIVAPEDLAGLSLWDMQAWLQTLEPGQQEAARLLRWGNMLANGRIIPLEDQSNAKRMPPNCYTFQPQRADVARRVGRIVDFSNGDEEPLARYQAFS
ncbi:MAG: hypothetical protein ACR2PS_04670 [Pseudomonadales bacterium]